MFKIISAYQDQRDANGGIVSESDMIEEGRNFAAFADARDRADEIERAGHEEWERRGMPTGAVRPIKTCYVVRQGADVVRD